MAQRDTRKQSAAAAKAPAKKPPAKKTSAKSAPAKKAAPRTSPLNAPDPASSPVPVPAVLAGRIPVTDVWPVVESGRMPAKAVVGEQVAVRATVFREGHGSLGVEVVLRDPSGREHSRRRMRDLGTGVDIWGADVVPDAQGRWTFSIEAWDDPWETW